MYDPRRGSVRAWLSTITHNLAVDVVRARSALPMDPDDLPVLLTAMTANPERVAVANDSAAELRQALARLPAPQARAVAMSRIYGMTAGQVAELALGVLTGGERAIAVAHLDQCEDCREDVRRVMATSGQLLELLPPAEPPAGFETRVLDRLGLPAPAPGGAKLLRVPVRDSRPRRRQARRRLAAGAMGFAVIAAGLGGWRIGAVTSVPAASSAVPMTTTRLLSAKQQDVGNIFLYSGSPRWLYMSVDLGGGNESVTCQVIEANGRVTTIGSFRLTGGYGGWGTPDPDNAGTLRGARLLSGDGTMLATATFTRW